MVPQPVSIARASVAHVNRGVAPQLPSELVCEVVHFVVEDESAHRQNCKAVEVGVHPMVRHVLEVLECTPVHCVARHECCAVIARCIFGSAVVGTSVRVLRRIEKLPGRQLGTRRVTIVEQGVCVAASLDTAVGSRCHQAGVVSTVSKRHPTAHEGHIR